MMACSSPAAIWRDNRSVASRPPKRFVRLSTASMSGAAWQASGEITVQALLQREHHGNDEKTQQRHPVIMDETADAPRQPRIERREPLFEHEQSGCTDNG